MSNYIITEELSVSNEVLEEMNRIVQLIILESNKQEWIRKQIFNYIYSDLKEFKIELDNSLFENVQFINCFIHDFDTYNELEKYGFLFNIGANFNQKEKAITLNVYSIKKEVNMMFLKTTLAHEIEHVYQTYKSGKTLVSNLYIKSNQVKQTESNEVINIMSLLIYSLSQVEIDAKLHEFYIMLKDNKIKTNQEAYNTPCYKHKEECCDKAIKNYMSLDRNSDDFAQALKYFDITDKWFIYFINKMLKYYNIKLAKVVQRHLNELVNINEVAFNKFKQFYNK